MSLEVLMDERAIHIQVCSIALAMDRRDWGKLDELIAEDATGDFGEDYHLTGRGEFVQLFKKFLGNCGPTQHLLGNFVASVEGDNATSHCYVRDIHQGSGGRADQFLSTPGEYLDRWARTPAGWRLTHRTKHTFMMNGSIDVLGVVP